MSGDAEDSWLFNSMARYKNISMFDFGYTVTHIERSDNEHLCLVGHLEDLKKDEIMEVILPKKLLVDESQEGLERDADLKIERGAFATSQIFQVKAVVNERKLISSEDEKYGVSIYDLGSGPNGAVNRLHEYSCDHLVPRFSFNGVNNILMATTNQKPLTMMDMKTGQIIQTINLEKNPGKDLMLEPEFLTKDVAGICNKNTGAVHIKDTRGVKDTITFNVSNFDQCSTATNLRQLWTVASPYQQSTLTESHNSNGIKFACISTGGQFLAYDVRNSKKVFCTASINKSDAGGLSNLSLKVTPSFTRFAVSGLDEKVYVHDIDEQGDLKLVFTHDGHPSVNNGSQNFVKCHMFLKDNVILSADDSKSVHCWQFVPNT